MYKKQYPVHFVAVGVKSTRMIVDQAFLVPKCVDLRECRIILTSCTVRHLTQFQEEPILGKKFEGYASWNFSDFERYKQIGSTAANYNAVDESVEIHRKMMQVEPQLEAWGKRNWWSIMLTHDEFPYHCLLQTKWYPGRCNLVLIWDSGELLSLGSPDSSQSMKFLIVGVVAIVGWNFMLKRTIDRKHQPKNI